MVKVEYDWNLDIRNSHRMNDKVSMIVFRYATPELGPAYMTVYPLLRTIILAALRLLSPSHSSQMMPR